MATNPPCTNKGGQTHTSERGKDKRNPWWQLDLGKEVSIDKISVWNRGEGFSSRLKGFTVKLLNANKKTVFAHKDTPAPAGSIHLSLKGKQPSITFLDEKGKASKIAQVPEGYKDPSPFTFQKNDTIAIVGNGLADHMQHHGWTETLIQSSAKGKDITFRNLSLSGDRPNKRPRSKGFTSEAD